jgi:hypothetical protein
MARNAGRISPSLPQSIRRDAKCRVRCRIVAYRGLKIESGAATATRDVHV